METTNGQDKKTAVVIGATGLVGSYLIDQLIDDDRYIAVKAFTRKAIGKEHPKLKNFVINFENLSEYAGECQGNDFFSCLGTTIKKAGSKKNQYHIDFHYQLKFARMASKNRMDNYLLVSAAGANANSNIFYNQMKGALEKEIQQLVFKNITILRPSVLVGKRNEKRRAEKLAAYTLRALSFIKPIRRYKPIHGSIVAKALIESANTGQEDLFIYELDDLFKLAA